MKSNTSELLQTAGRLIAIESTDNNPSGLRKVIKSVCDFFEGSPVIIEKSESAGYPSVVITTRPTRSPQIMLHGHLDVVEGTPEQFAPQLTGGKLFGRGAVDMKGFVAVAMHVIRDLSYSDSPPDIGLMINTDEEISGHHGAQRLANDRWLPAQMINGDGGYGHALTYAQKGIVQLELEANVAPGLRYAPWDGIGAAELLVRKLNKGLEIMCPRQDELTETDNWGSTACVLKIETSDNTPLPPHIARASVRLYWAEDHSGEQVIELARKSFAPLEVTGTVDAERVFLSPDSPDLLRLRDLWQQHLGEKIDIRADNGSSDAKWFAPLGIPILIMRIPGGGAHSTKEWLEVNALEPLYTTLCDYIVEKCESVENQSAVFNAEGK